MAIDPIPFRPTLRSSGLGKFSIRKDVGGVQRSFRYPRLVYPPRTLRGRRSYNVPHSRVEKGVRFYARIQPFVARLGYRRISDSFTSSLAELVFNENYFLLHGLLTKLQKTNYMTLQRKIRYIKTRVNNQRKVYYIKKKVKFHEFVATDRRNQTVKITAVQKLIQTALSVRQGLISLARRFSTRPVGKEVYYLLKSIMSKYFEMYQQWSDNVRWGFFDEELPFRTKRRLMKFFWFFKSKRKIRGAFWMRAFGRNHKHNFRYVARLGHSMRSQKITDLLFFWHAFTRRRPQQTSWLVRAKQFFRTFLSYRVRRYRAATNPLCTLVQSSRLHSPLMFLLYGQTVVRSGGGRVREIGLFTFSYIKRLFYCFYLSWFRFVSIVFTFRFLGTRWVEGVLGGLSVVRGCRGVVSTSGLRGCGTVCSLRWFYYHPWLWRAWFHVLSYFSFDIKVDFEK